MRLFLASASPRRAELLRAAGFSFETIAVDVDERPQNREAPDAYVARLAEAKSAAGLAARAEGAGIVVLGADTTVVVDGDILAKPADHRDAEAMLRRLSGRRHDVLTGVSVRTRSTHRSLVESTAVYVARLTDQDVAWYIASGEWRDKAGSYAIQGLASRFVARIDGSYSNVVGLPIAAVVALLSDLPR